MKKHTFIVSLLLASLSGLPASADRTDQLLNQNWQFRFSHQVEKNTQRVDLPHTWNAQDALSGKRDYKRGIGNYTKQLEVPAEWKGKRVFLRFEGANSVTNLFVNGKHAGEHRGGYGAFVYELTDQLKYGKKNELWVRVNNAEQLDVMPLVGDFNFYGGIYRNVHLIVTEPVCISPLDYASPGVYLVQQQVSEDRAEVGAKVCLSNAADQAQSVTLKVQVKEGDKVVCTQQKSVTVGAKTDRQLEQAQLVIDRPHLWNGTEDPFLYRVEVSVLDSEGNELDCMEQPLGLRYYHTDPDQGFFLNGKHLALHGVCRHQERAEVGNALRFQHHAEDMALMQEMGVNAIRLAHYPQSTDMYSLADRAGMVVWAEIPFVGPGGYADKGFVDQPSFRENGKQQLIELIRQHYNHPSICFWGLFNELKAVGDNPEAYIAELQELAKAEDTTRPTTAASNQQGKMNFITDNIAWNRYDGWYGSTPNTLATYLDKMHAEHPQLKIAISEYGAGASIYQQQEEIKQSVPNSWWHPENWQTEYHIRNWEILSARPFVWGSFVWNMFDFGAAHRLEGDRPGINDKGLVTHDRKVRKDAFYFYKANWNAQPMVYIEGHRNNQRTLQQTSVRVFSNCKEVVLKVNGQEVGRQQPDRVKVCTFEGVQLQPGKNELEVTAKQGKKVYTDRCCWVLTK